MILLWSDPSMPFSCYIRASPYYHVPRCVSFSVFLPGVGCLNRHGPICSSHLYHFVLIPNCFRPCDVIHSTQDLGLGPAFFAFLSLQKSRSYNLALGFVLKDHIAECRRLRLHNTFNLIILVGILPLPVQGVASARCAYITRTWTFPCPLSLLSPGFLNRHGSICSRGLHQFV